VFAHGLTVPWGSLAHSCPSSLSPGRPRGVGKWFPPVCRKWNGLPCCRFIVTGSHPNRPRRGNPDTEFHTRGPGVCWVFHKPSTVENWARPPRPWIRSPPPTDWLLFCFERYDLRVFTHRGGRASPPVPHGHRVTPSRQAFFPPARFCPGSDPSPGWPSPTIFGLCGPHVVIGWGVTGPG